MTKLNRGELLVKAIKGEIKTGDKFKRVDTSDVVRFDGRSAHKLYLNLYNLAK